MHRKKTSPQRRMGNTPWSNLLCLHEQQTLLTANNTVFPWGQPSIQGHQSKTLTVKFLAQMRDGEAVLALSLKMHNLIWTM